MLAKVILCAKFCEAVTETAIFHLKRGIKEFAEDVEVETMEIWDNIRELFQREEL